MNKGVNKVSFLELVGKQICARAAYECEDSKQQKRALLAPAIVKAIQVEDDVGIYSLRFLKSLHENTRDSLYKLMKTKDPNDPNSVEVPVGLNCLDHNDFTAPEREALLNFSYKVKDMAPSNSKNWIDLRHFMHYVYRNFFASFSLFPSNECLTPYFLDEMRGLVRSLIQEDESQLYLRVLALLREYCIFAQFNYTKEVGQTYIITTLFNYYHAMLRAADKIKDVFAGIKVLTYRNYKMGWKDFNAYVFIRYFLETDYVQQKIKQVLKRGESPGDSPAMFEFLENLQSLSTTLQNRIKNINDDHSLVVGSGTYFIEEVMIFNHKEVLTTNFWIERTEQEKSGLHLERFDHHLFRLLGDPYFRSAGPILDNDAQCICEECLVGKYAILIHPEKQLENELLRSTARVIFCRRCRKLLELESFHAHVATVHWVGDEAKAIIKDNTTKVGQSLVLCEEPPEVSQRIPMSEEATDAAAMTTCDIHFSRHCEKVVFDDSILNPNTFASNLTPSVSVTKKKAEPSPRPKEIPKTSRKTKRFASNLTPSVSPTKKKAEPSPKPKEIPKTSRKTERFASNLTASVSQTKKKAEPSPKPKEIPKTSRKTERRQGQKTKT